MTAREKMVESPALFERPLARTFEGVDKRISVVKITAPIAAKLLRKLFKNKTIKQFVWALASFQDCSEE